MRNLIFALLFIPAILTMDILAFFIIPLPDVHLVPFGSECKILLEKYDFVGGCSDMHEAWVFFPSFSGAAHEEVHNFGYGEFEAYSVMFMAFFAYAAIYEFAFNKIEEVWDDF